MKSKIKALLCGALAAVMLMAMLASCAGEPSLGGTPSGTPAASGTPTASVTLPTPTVPSATPTPSVPTGSDSGSGTPTGTVDTPTQSVPSETPTPTVPTDNPGQSSDSDTTPSADTNPGETLDPNTEIMVVRLIRTFEVGKKILKGGCELVTVCAGDLPEGYFTTIDDVAGKYASELMVAGDIVLKQKLADKAPDSVNAGGTGAYYPNSNFVMAKPNSAGEKLQELIDANPGKTIYLPDGTYSMSKPLVISADPAKAVSLVMSNFAHVSANALFPTDRAVIEVGSATEVIPSGANGPESAKIVITGGTIFGNDKVTGLKIMNAENVYYHHGAVKNASIGIHLAKGANYNTVENVNMTGNKKESAIGVFVEGNGNKVTNMRFCENFIGVDTTGANNIYRNLHPLFIQPKNDAGFTNSVGFRDKGTGSFYEYCYSDQYAKGYEVSSNCRSILNSCFVYWYQSGIGAGTASATLYPIHYGLYAPQDFNCIIIDSRFDMCHAGEVDNAYVRVIGGGSGAIINPITSSGNWSGDDHSSDRTKFTKLG